MLDLRVALSWPSLLLALLSGGCSGCSSCAAEEARLSDGPNPSLASASRPGASADRATDAETAANVAPSASARPKTLAEELDDLDLEVLQLSADGCVPCVDCAELDPTRCSTEHCAKGAPCKIYGRCRASQGRCVADTDAQCAASANCTRRGYCKKRGDVCAASGDSCKASDACKATGSCVARGGLCVPGSDADCSQSTDCKRLGDCASRAGACVPTETMHCKASDLCKRHQMCRLEGGRCVE